MVCFAFGWCCSKLHKIIRGKACVPLLKTGQKEYHDIKEIGHYGRRKTEVLSYALEGIRFFEQTCVFTRSHIKSDPMLWQSYFDYGK